MIIESITVQTPSARGAATLYKYRGRNLITRQKVDITLKGTESLDEADFERRPVKMMYTDPGEIHLLDQENYNQYSIALEDIKEQTAYITEGLEGMLALIYNDECVGIQIPTTVELKVTQCDPVDRGNSATGRTKPATLETGLTVNVPEYLAEGELIKVDSRTGEFIGPGVSSGGCRSEPIDVRQEFLFIWKLPGFELRVDQAPSIDNSKQPPPDGSSSNPEILCFRWVRIFSAKTDGSRLIASLSAISQMHLHVSVLFVFPGFLPTRLGSGLGSRLGSGRAARTLLANTLPQPSEYFFVAPLRRTVISTTGHQRGKRKQIQLASTASYLRPPNFQCIPSTISGSAFGT